MQPTFLHPFQPSVPLPLRVSARALALRFKHAPRVCSWRWRVVGFSSSRLLSRLQLRVLIWLALACRCSVRVNDAPTT